MSPRDRDYNVLTIGRVTPPQPDQKHLLPDTYITTIYAWQGTGHDALYAEIADILKTWQINHIAVDATAIGEAAAILLARALGEHRVTAYRFTQQSKSHLGYQLQAAANTARLHLWAPDGTPEHNEATRQLTLCRAEYRPNKTVTWQVDPSDGHDDYISSIALCAEAAAKVRVRRAHGRIPKRP